MDPYSIFLTPCLISFQDLGEFGTHDYAIASGNVGNVFEVSYDVSNPRLDLVVKGELDRERVEAYTLVIVARDGGSPPRTGSLTLKVNVQVLTFFFIILATEWSFLQIFT